MIDWLYGLIPTVITKPSSLTLNKQIYISLIDFINNNIFLCDEEFLYLFAHYFVYIFIIN